jgi:hypothetical protein
LRKWNKEGGEGVKNNPAKLLMVYARPDEFDGGWSFLQTEMTTSLATIALQGKERNSSTGGGEFPSRNPVSSRNRVSR